MENTIELNEINEVDLGDDALTADPTPRSGVAASTKCTLDEPVVVEFESGDGDGAGVGVGVGAEGGSAAFQKSGMTFHQLQ
jgi:hypothetical protein